MKCLVYLLILSGFILANTRFVFNNIEKCVYGEFVGFDKRLGNYYYKDKKGIKRWVFDLDVKLININSNTIKYCEVVYENSNR